MGGIYSPNSLPKSRTKNAEKNAKQSLRKSMKRQNTKSDVLTIGTVCCGHRKVAWIQNLFQLLARLQIIPLETRGMVGILFAKTDRSVGRHSTFFMMPLRYTIHLHMTKYIMFASLSFLKVTCGAVPDATPNVSQYFWRL